MRSDFYIRLAVFGAVAFSLSACDTLRREAGLTKQAPDEFAVVTKAPLIIPPNFNLRPPAPGAPPLNQEDPTNSAEAALYNGSDPATVAASMPSSVSLGERMMLATAGVQNSDPGIRAELAADSRTDAAAADQSFTDRVLSGSLSPSTVQKKPAPQTNSGGWFGWLF